MNDNAKPKIVAVAGPTASGKSRLAVEIALALGGEVISADSMQIYRGMDVGTGKITPKETKGVPHHLLDVAEPEESFSLAEYCRLAGEAIEEVLSRGALPVLCGGTGLYLDGILAGRALGDAPANEALRKELEERDPDRLYEELCAIDPESAAAIHKNNRKRVIRALEIYRLTGRTKTDWDAASKTGGSRYAVKKILLFPRDRQALYDAINARVDAMFAAGLEEEARALFARSPSATAAQGIGYKEFLPYFGGRATLEDTKEAIKKASRNYAKRQLTWFSKSAGDSLCLDSAEDPQAQIEKALRYIGQ